MLYLSAADQTRPDGVPTTAKASRRLADHSPERHKPEGEHKAAPIFLNHIAYYEGIRSELRPAPGIGLSAVAVPDISPFPCALHCRNGLIYRNAEPAQPSCVITFEPAGRAKRRRCGSKGLKQPRWRQPHRRRAHRRVDRIKPSKLGSTVRWRGFQGWKDRVIFDLRLCRAASQEQYSPSGERLCGRGTRIHTVNDSSLGRAPETAGGDQAALSRSVPGRGTAAYRL